MENSIGAGMIEEPLDMRSVLAFAYHGNFLLPLSKQSSKSNYLEMSNSAP
ncbi:hypothetical protein [Algoriphagus namhaensis]